MSAHGRRVAGAPIEAVDNVITVKVGVKGVPQTPSGERGTVGTRRKLPTKGVAVITHSIPPVSQILRIQDLRGVVASKTGGLFNAVTRAGALILIEPRDRRH